MVGKAEVRGVKDTPVDCGEEPPIREVLKVLPAVGGRVDTIDVTVTVEGIAVAVTVTYTTSQTMIFARQNLIRLEGH